MKKYFQIHDYLGNKKAKIAIYNLSGRASIWQEHIRQVKGIKERRIVWKQFKKSFKRKYLYTRYYNNKRKEIDELKLRQIPMEEYVNKFLELLWYVDYIKEESVKIQSFLSGMLQNYRDKIEFVNPQTLDEVI